MRELGEHSRRDESDLALFFCGLGAISKSSFAHTGMHGATAALPCGPSPLAFSITINYDRILIKIPFSKNEYGASAAKVLLDSTARQTSGATAAAAREGEGWGSEKAGELFEGLFLATAAACFFNRPNCSTKCMVSWLVENI